MREGKEGVWGGGSRVACACPEGSEGRGGTKAFSPLPPAACPPTQPITQSPEPRAQTTMVELIRGPQSLTVVVLICVYMG